MPIYTKTGDNGITSLYGGKRILKSDVRIRAYGSIDELSSFIGLTLLRLDKSPDQALLITIQKNLYQIMAFLSGSKVRLNNVDKQTAVFEKIIDQIDNQLPQLNHFVLPGGTELSGWLHILRTVCRRAERGVVKLTRDKTSGFTVPALIIRYFNRLSDLFYVLARKYGRGRESLI